MEEHKVEIPMFEHIGCHGEDEDEKGLVLQLEPMEEHEEVLKLNRMDEYEEIQDPTSNPMDKRKEN